MSDYTEHLISMAGGDGEPDLDAIQSRADAATEGPWRLYDGKRDARDAAVETAWAYDAAGGDTELITDWCKPDDAAFISHARTDVPALLAVVRSQQAKIERVEALCTEWDAVVDVFPLTPAALFAGSHAKRVRAALTATEGVA